MKEKIKSSVKSVGDSIGSLFSKEEKPQMIDKEDLSQETIWNVEKQQLELMKQTRIFENSLQKDLIDIKSFLANVKDFKELIMAYRDETREQLETKITEQKKVIETLKQKRAWRWNFNYSAFISWSAFVALGLFSAWLRTQGEFTYSFWFGFFSVVASIVGVVYTFGAVSTPGKQRGK